MNASIRSVTTRSVLAAAGLLTACALTACGSTYSAAPQKAAATGAATTTSAAPSATEDTPEATDSAAPGDAGAAEDVGRTPTTLKKVKTAKMGDVVTDEKGWILYRYDKDTANPSKSNCDGDCAEVWPPVVADDQELEGLDAAKISEVTRSDGTKQVTLDGWPLYYYLGDTEPGDWTGQNVGKVWFAVAPDGSKNLTCVPDNPPPTPSVDDDDDDASPSAAAGNGGDSY